jgi:hypothetical protein
MLSRSVKPTGDRHSHGYVAGADAPDRLVARQGCAGQRQRYFRVAVRTVVGAQSGKSAGHFRLYMLSGKAGNSAGPQQHGPDIHVPGKLGRGRPQPGRMPRDDGIAGTGRHRHRLGRVIA